MAQVDAPALLNVHTPSSSFTIVHSLTQDSLEDLCSKVTKKVQSMYHRKRATAGWLKYEFNGTIWNLDDDSDYTIFTWRQQQRNPPENDPLGTTASVSSTATAGEVRTPTLHLHDPTQPLPQPPDYQNQAYYIFNRPSVGRISPSQNSKAASTKTTKNKSKSTLTSLYPQEDGSIPKLKREFDKFHSENGVRTVMGSIGPVKNVRMLLKSGYRHVYISRKFALEHGFIPADAAPGHYGYSGLVNLGTWPITLAPSISQPNPLPNPTSRRKSAPTLINVYLSEEPHFDVVLGRSFFEKRQIRTTDLDMTDVVCLDTGEKIECELVVLKDGRGEIVTVT